MKSNFLRAVNRHAFLILKYGLFIIICMFALTFLYCDILLQRDGYATSAYLFYILPLARAMVEYTLSSLVLVFGCAFLAIAFEKYQNFQ